MNTDNIDRFGHCCVCHRNMITKRVVDGKVIDMFLPDHDHTDFLLSNGSIMKVCMCKSCKEKVDLTSPKVHGYIMEACMKGWELETKLLIADEKLPYWTEESAKVYLDKMAELKIDTHADSVSPVVVQNRVKELTAIMAEGLKVREIKNSKDIEILEVREIKNSDNVEILEVVDGAH